MNMILSLWFFTHNLESDGNEFEFRFPTSGLRTGTGPQRETVEKLII